MPTELTPEGAKIAQLGGKELLTHGEALLSGKENVMDYTKGVCYTAAAFAAYANGSKKISADDLASIAHDGWIKKFKALNGKKWDGSKGISKGKIVAFYRLVDKKQFHFAVGVGGTKVRGVNGGALSPGWKEATDIKKVLGAPDENGQFDYDNTKIEVWICPV